MIIRPAGHRDAELIYQVHVRAIRELCASHYTPEQIKMWSDDKAPEKYLKKMEANPFFVAEIDEKLVGFARYNISSHEFSSLYIHPDYARKGIGTALAEFVFADAKNNGITKMWLDGAMNAVSFYQSVGFKFIEETHHNFGDFSLKCARMEIKFV